MRKEGATVRCAIYTRKSTEEGLDQEFNSLDAQRESAEAFIRSQKGAGWKLVPARYDDGVGNYFLIGVDERRSQHEGGEQCVGEKLIIQRAGDHP